MRVGVDYRILSVGKELLNRGICRYTQQQLRAVLAMDAQNEYVLLCNTGNDLSFIDPVIRQAPNVEIRHFPAHLQEGTTLGDTSVMLRHAEEYQDWIFSPRLGSVPCNGSVPFRATRAHRLRRLPHGGDLLRRHPADLPRPLPLGLVEGTVPAHARLPAPCDRMIAISEAAKTDATVYLGFPPDRIDVAWPIPDECFRPLSPAVLVGSLARLRTRIPLPDRYVLTVSHLHHTKNLQTLLRGYALLPAALRARLPLVVGCHLDPSACVPSRPAGGRAGHRRQRDDHRAGHRRGAGRPLQRAPPWSCTRPATRASACRCSRPCAAARPWSPPPRRRCRRPGGDAAVLVDPEDVDGFARAIEALRGRRGSRAGRWPRAGLAHAARFNPEQLGRATLAGYAAAVRPRSRQPAPARPRPGGVDAAAAAADRDRRLQRRAARPAAPAARRRGVRRRRLPPAGDLLVPATGSTTQRLRAAPRAAGRFDAVHLPDGRLVLPLVHVRRHAPAPGHRRAARPHRGATCCTPVRARQRRLRGLPPPADRAGGRRRPAAEFDRHPADRARASARCSSSSCADHRMLGPSSAQPGPGRALRRRPRELEAPHPERRRRHHPDGRGRPLYRAPAAPTGSGVRAGAGRPRAAFVVGVFGIVHPPSGWRRACAPCPALRTPGPTRCCSSSAGPSRRTCTRCRTWPASSACWTGPLRRPRVDRSEFDGACWRATWSSTCGRRPPPTCRPP